MSFFPLPFLCAFLISVKNPPCSHANEDSEDARVEGLRDMRRMKRTLEDCDIARYDKLGHVLRQLQGVHILNGRVGPEVDLAVVEISLVKLAGKAEKQSPLLHRWNRKVV